MKRIVCTVAVISSFAMAAPAFAADGGGVVPAGTSAVAAPVSDADAAMLFGETPASSQMQLASLSSAEMKQTEGAIIWVPLLARMGGGAALGGGAVMGNHFMNGGSYSNIPWRQVGYGAAVGAVGGGWSRYVKVKGW